MKHEDKVAKLGMLNESELRRQVLIPLLTAMGFSSVYINHGSHEKGKDLIFREVSPLKEIFVHAAVVSKNDITGTVGDAKSAERILDQVRMALDEPYVDLYTGRTTSADRCWVITSGRILPSAIDSIAGHLQRSHLDKLVRFIDGTRLVALIDDVYSQYWESDAKITYYSGEIIDISGSRLDPPFDKDVDDLPSAGSLNNSVYQIKRLVHALMLDIEYEITDKFAAILRSNHPWVTITLWEGLQGNQIDQNGHAYLGSAVDKIHQHWQYLVEDVLAYEERFDIAREDRMIPRRPSMGSTDY